MDCLFPSGSAVGRHGDGLHLWSLCLISRRRPLCTPSHGHLQATAKPSPGLPRLPAAPGCQRDWEPGGSRLLAGPGTPEPALLQHPAASVMPKTDPYSGSLVGLRLYFPTPGAGYWSIFQPNICPAEGAVVWDEHLKHPMSHLTQWPELWAGCGSPTFNPQISMQKHSIKILKDNSRNISKLSFTTIKYASSHGCRDGSICKYP